MMSINRFEKIRQYFHCNDNSVCPSKSHQNYDKLFKARPVINSVLDKQVSTARRNAVDR